MLGAMALLVEGYFGRGSRLWGGAGMKEDRSQVRDYRREEQLERS